MKKIILFAVLQLFAVMTYAQVSHSFVFQTSDFTTYVDKDKFTIIENEDFYNYTTEEGAPKLPVLTRSFVLPAGSTVTNINIDNSGQTLLATHAVIYPAQPPEEWDSIPEFVPPDSVIYNSGATFKIKSS